MEDTDAMNIVLRYRGPAVESGAMSVYDAAAAMVAFSDFVVSAAKHTYGEQAQVRAEVQGFRHGSFATDLIFVVAGVGQVLPVIAAQAKPVLETIKCSIEVFKHLRGQPPQKLEHRDGQQVVVTNNNGQIIVVNTPSVTLTLSEKGGEAVAKFIGDALRGNRGLHDVSIEHAGRPLARVAGDEADYFHPIDTDRLLTEQIVTQGLMLETPSFKDGNKWRFSDGIGSMAIAIEDEDFLKRVDDGEAFHKGDVLIAQVRWTQYQSGKQLKSERAIVKVLEHRERVGEQFPLIAPNNEPG